MATLRYDFSVVGVKNVERAFASIEKRAVRHNLRMSRAFGGDSRARQGGGNAVATATKQAELANRRRIASELREERRAAREKIRLDKYRQDMRNRYWAQEARKRQQTERAQVRAAKKAAESVVKERRRVAGSIFGTIGKSTRGTLRAVGATAGGALAIGGGLGMSMAVGQQMRETAMASGLANQAGNPKIKGALLREAQGVRGFTGEEALAGMSAFVEKTGNVDAARSMIAEMGKVAVATGTSLEDLSRTAGQAFNVLSDTASSPQEAISQTQELLAVLAKQGEMGAVEISDLARDFGKLGAATRAFEGGAPELLRSMGAFAQIAVARGGADTSADASTAAARLAGDIVTNKKKFSALGVDIKSENDPTKLRDPLSIMLDVLDATGGDIEKTSGLFGMESKKIFSGLAATYSTARAAGGDGRAAVTKEFNSLAGARLSQADLEARFNSRMSDPDMQFKEAMKGFNAQVGDKLLPELTKLIPVLAEMTPVVTALLDSLIKILDWAKDNPFQSLGMLISGAILKDLAAAGIGGAVKDKLIAMLTASGGSGVPGAPGVPTVTPVGGGTTGSKRGSMVGAAASAGAMTAAVAILTERVGALADVAVSDDKLGALGKHVRESTGAIGDDATVTSVAGVVSSLNLPFISDLARAVGAGRLIAGALDPQEESKANAEEMRKVLSEANKAGASVAADQKAAAAMSLRAAELQVQAAQSRGGGSLPRPPSPS